MKEKKPQHPNSRANLVREESKYKPEYCEILLKHRQQGLTMKSFPATLHKETGVKINKNTPDQWRKQHPEFNLVCEVGESYMHLSWEKFGLDSCTKKDFNAVWAMFLSRNMVGYNNLDTSKLRIAVEPQVQLSKEEKQSKLKELQEQIQKFNNQVKT